MTKIRYFCKPNSTLGSVVPLAMFLFWTPRVPFLRCCLCFKIFSMKSCFAGPGLRCPCNNVHSRKWFSSRLLRPDLDGELHGSRRSRAHRSQRRHRHHPHRGPCRRQGPRPQGACTQGLCVLAQGLEQVTSGVLLAMIAIEQNTHTHHTEQ